MSFLKLQEPWFPKKRYGIGWGLPTRWQGWLVVLAFFLTQLALPYCPLVRSSDAARWVGRACIFIAFIVVVAITGEKKSQDGNFEESGAHSASVSQVQQETQLAKKPWTGWIVLMVLLTLLGIFVWCTSYGLPPIVASHFSVSGTADEYMSHKSYSIIMVLMIIGLPLLVTLLPALIAGRNGTRLNIPHRKYWFAPERRDETLLSFHRLLQESAAIIALLLVYSNWLVIRANHLRTPELPVAPMIGGLVVFLIVLTARIIIWRRHFRLPH